MSSRLNDLIRIKTERGQKLLSVFVTAGYPTLDATEEILLTLNEAGVDFIELGMPFSDPIADGPVIQKASDLAIQNGANLEFVLNTVQNLRRSTAIPILLMGYLNPVYHWGITPFIADAANAGADGLIIPDWVPEESITYQPQLEAADLDLIQLVAPNTCPERIKVLDERSTSFIYCMAYTGVTGQSGNSNKSINFLTDMRQQTTHPLMVGFGIKNRRDYLHYTRYADGVIIGSAFLNMLAKATARQRKAQILKFIKNIRPKD